MHLGNDETGRAFEVGVVHETTLESDDDVIGNPIPRDQWPVSKTISALARGALEHYLAS